MSFRIVQQYISRQYYCHYTLFSLEFDKKVLSTFMNRTEQLQLFCEFISIKPINFSVWLPWSFYKSCFGGITNDFWWNCAQRNWVPAEDRFIFYWIRQIILFNLDQICWEFLINSHLRIVLFSSREVGRWDVSQLYNQHSLRDYLLGDAWDIKCTNANSFLVFLHHMIDETLIRKASPWYRLNKFL